MSLLTFFCKSPGICGIIGKKTQENQNGKTKTLRSNYGPVDIRVPQDRNSDYEPRIVPKYSRDISEIDEKIIRMYARGMSTRQISDQIMDIYGFEVSEALVTDVTNKILPEIESWQKRPLCAVYPIVYIDAIVFNVRDNGIIRKQAAYVILGISEEGHKEVLSITIGESESAKFWLSVLNELKNRGVKDIFVLCADGLTGIGDAIAAAFPMTEYQRCIVHMVRNTLKYVADKDRKEFANDLKTICHAPDEEQGYRNMQAVAEKWDKKVVCDVRRQALLLPPARTILNNVSTLLVFYQTALETLAQILYGTCNSTSYVINYVCPHSLCDDLPLIFFVQLVAAYNISKGDIFFKTYRHRLG